jgi:hypothetical protein
MSLQPGASITINGMHMVVQTTPVQNKINGFWTTTAKIASGAWVGQIKTLVGPQANGPWTLVSST